MIDSQQCITILDAMVEGFEKRIEKIKEYKAEIENCLQNEKLITNEKIQSAINKELSKIEKQIYAMDAKVESKQEKLLNSNHLEELEKEILNNAKSINADDIVFLQSLEDIVNEVKTSEVRNEIEFAFNYIVICEKSTLKQKTFYEKQLNFLKEVFKEEKE